MLLRATVCTTMLAALLVIGCGDDDGGPGTDALIDELFDLERRQARLHCGCVPDPESCPPPPADARQLSCYKSVAAQHASELQPELACRVRLRKAENACFEQAECSDVDAWEACWDAGEDCDDHASERYEDDISACEGMAGRESSAPPSTSGGDGGGVACTSGSCADAGPSATPDAATADPAGSGGSGAGGSMAIADAGVPSGGSSGDAGESPGLLGACPATAGARVLFVFDVSASMQESFDGSTRLAAATEAVEHVLADYDPALQVAALHFPTAACVPGIPPMAGGAVAALSTSPQIPFQPATDFLSAWPQTIDQSATIGTPLQEAFDRANDALGDLTSAAPTVVVLVTDGEGNCFQDDPVAETPPTRVSTWAAAGARTWVITFGAVAADGELANIATAAATPLGAPTTSAELDAALTAAIDTVGCR